MTDNPEIGRRIRTGGFETNYHDRGEGPPVLLIHGSGPGVSAWANWRLTLPALAGRYRAIAPDMVGFGYTERPEGITYDLDTWCRHALDVLDALDIGRAHIVGNSFGGGLALALALRHPERVGRLVLMGSVGVSFELTPGLDTVWGYTPSVENMRGLLDIFAYSRELVSDELAEMRYQASVRPGVQEAYAAMFPAPRQRWVDAMASPEDEIRTLDAETLIVHGRDDRVIPPENAHRLHELIGPSQLHVFGRCGHWTQIEHAHRFNRLVSDFLAEAGDSL
ncbi:alpha/beta fold hydrolase [Arhodomonas aquaeolei]|uniref:alpha/beta fold hydrolase n=1 Tax=Arhodomonas aquaeolei TaxID=2369 RepID=UPI00037AA17B|nr:alpha/beta fold hydrolase [Arhodomonas aquaeolei]